LYSFPLFYRLFPPFSREKPRFLNTFEGLNTFRIESISGLDNINLTFCKQCRYRNRNNQSARWRAKRPQWLGMTHAARWHAHRHTGGVTWGRGHLYQSRFRSFPIQQDHHF
jgi:hypothetical protein